MHSNTTLLITGANRGLGKGLVKLYLSRPNVTVIAGVRDPGHLTSKTLSRLPKGASSTLIVLKIESASESNAAAAVESLQTMYNITVLDVVIANAGISKVLPVVAKAEAADLKEHFLVNVIGVVVLFKAVLPLLERSKCPKFVTLSSSAASIGDMELRNFPNAAYGTSKVALNYITRKIHFENPNLIAFPLDPGWVQTEMGNSGAVALGFAEAEITVEKSVTGMVKVIDGATSRDTSGQFLCYDGDKVVW